PCNYSGAVLYAIARVAIMGSARREGPRRAPPIRAVYVRNARDSHHWKLRSAVRLIDSCQFWQVVVRKQIDYFFAFVDSRFDSLGSFNSFLESPGRYSSCSAAAKAFSRPTMSSPGLSVSNASDSLRNSSSE